MDCRLPWRQPKRSGAHFDQSQRHFLFSASVVLSACLARRALGIGPGVSQKARLRASSEVGGHPNGPPGRSTAEKSWQFAQPNSSLTLTQDNLTQLHPGSQLERLLVIELQCFIFKSGDHSCGFTTIYSLHNSRNVYWIPTT